MLRQPNLESLLQLLRGARQYGGCLGNVLLQLFRRVLFAKRHRDVFHVTFHNVGRQQ